MQNKLPKLQIVAAAIWLLLFVATGDVRAEAPVPELVEKDGRFALLVDGAPFLILGAQTNNSSNYPAMLPKV